MWEWVKSKSFDVATGSIQTMTSCHALNFAWGEHALLDYCKHDHTHMYSVHTGSYHEMMLKIYILTIIRVHVHVYTTTVL